MGDNKYGKEQSFEEMAENEPEVTINPATGKPLIVDFGQEEPKKEDVKTDETTE
jgi:hypothetical protein